VPTCRAFSGQASEVTRPSIDGLYRFSLDSVVPANVEGGRPEGGPWVDQSQGDVASCSIDLTGLDLDALAAMDNTVLANALRALRHEMEHPEEAAAGFQSSL
jgi:FXSXX-COOH protein